MRASMRARVCFAFNVSVYVSLQRPRHHRKPAPLFHIWRRHWPRYRALLQAPRGPGGRWRRTIPLLFKRSTLRPPAGVLHRHLVCGPAVAMATAEGRLYAAGREKVCSFLHSWENKINKAARQHCGFPAAKLMHISSAVKVLIYNWGKTRTPPDAHLGEGSLHPWRGRQSSAGPHVSLCGFGTLLKGTSAVLCGCASTFCMHWGSNQEPSTSQPSSQQIEPPPSPVTVQNATRDVSCTQEEIHCCIFLSCVMEITWKLSSAAEKSLNYLSYWSCF